MGQDQSFHVSPWAMRISPAELVQHQCTTPHSHSSPTARCIVWRPNASGKHYFVAPAYINQKTKGSLPISSSPPSSSLPSGRACGSAASKCLRSARQRPLALETFGAETGGVLWSQHSRERMYLLHNSKNPSTWNSHLHCMQSAVLQFFHIPSKTRLSYCVL